MNIPSKYDPSLTEDKWYQYWLDNNIFYSEPDDREPYTVVIPPPNVTGVLHMGHMLNNTIQDVLIRRARMLGKNACWVPGTDHASIATEAKVVAKLKDEGIDKNKLTREEFLEHAWEWKEKHGGIILEQLKKLGASCDWKRTAFTMEEEYSESVINVFIDLFKKDKIYRGVRMVNWDPQAQTAVSDEEVIYKEVQSQLYYVDYKIYKNKKGKQVKLDFITIATTRPETILGDTAICINPEHPDYKELDGCSAVVPLTGKGGRKVKIIADDYVDMDFGTGALKITPSHDINDYEIGQRYNLESINVIDNNGKIIDKTGKYDGLDRFEARKRIAKDLKAAGKIQKIEDYTNKVGFSERTDAVIEPKLSMQWFVKMKDLAQPALEAVVNDDVQLHPAKFKNTYRHWMENVKDWCISRQLWWGHRIPVYYINNTNDFVVAKDTKEALKLAKEKTGDNSLTPDSLKQDEDVLDTWFSSWLWPISVFKGLKDTDNKDIAYYYPTNTLVTAPEILFFWVARMIISGYEYRGEKPFKDVYLTGIVRDKQRRKMSKSLGNSPDPIELMKKYSADGVRVGMLLCSPAGNDLLFDEGLTEQGRNFGNKIWNAFRLVKSWEVNDSTEQTEAAQEAIQWFNEKLNKAIEELESHYNNYKISEALMVLYRLFWDDFSSWYLETVKPPYQGSISPATLNETIAFFDKLLKLLHPFMPFITEEIWHLIEEREEGKSISTEMMPSVSQADNNLISSFEDIKEVITNVRNVRTEKNIAPKEPLELSLKLSDGSKTLQFKDVLIKLGNISTLNIVEEGPENAASFRVKANEFYVPMEDLINVEEELDKLEKELAYNKGFLQSVDKKLSNERFVNNAPEKVVAMEKKKKEDTEAKIVVIEDQIKALKKA